MVKEKNSGNSADSARYHVTRESRLRDNVFTRLRSTIFTTFTTFTLFTLFTIFPASLKAQTHEIGLEAGYGKCEYNSGFELINPFVRQSFNRFEINFLYDYNFKRNNHIKLESGAGYLHVNYLSYRGDSYKGSEPYADILTIPIGFEIYPDNISLFFFGGGFNMEARLKKYSEEYKSFVFGGYLCFGFNLEIVKGNRLKLKLKTNYDITEAFTGYYDTYRQYGTTLVLSYLHKIK